MLVLPLTKTRIPVMLGNVVELAGIFLAIYLIVLAPEVPAIPVKFLLYLVAWFCLLFFPHGLAHYVVGRLVGVRFRYYSLGKSSVSKLRMRFLGAIADKSVVLTLNVDRGSLQSVSFRGRIAMFSSGAVASMILPFSAALASLRDLPKVLSVFLLLLSAANLAFDLYFSPKAGDISRAISATKKSE